MRSLAVVRVWRVVVALGVLAAGLILSGGARASAMSCHRTPTPNPGPYQNQLNGVAVTSPHNAWAVGYYISGGVTGGPEPSSFGIIEHWNGRVWTLQPTPNLDGVDLTGVTATSSSNAWAVGYYDSFVGDSSVTAVVLHWNGRAWKAQAIPNVPGGQLSGVTATSPRSAWAVGTTAQGAGLILHWNGRAWKAQAIPTASGSVLSGVTATSPRSAWAVGTTAQGAGLILHWNGRVWKAQPAPKPRYGNPLQFQSVTVASTADLWTVGDQGIWRWNGRAWRVPTAPSNLQNIVLDGVVATSPTDVWVVGEQGIWRWNGRGWQSPVFPHNKYSYLYGVAATSPRNAWAVGWQYPVFVPGNPASYFPYTFALHCG